MISNFRLQAMCISALSKMCIEKEDLAKKIVPAFGTLLEQTKETVIKQALICSLADMCMRHANVVEPYLPQMIAKLQDRDNRVKRETLLHLVRLSRVSFIL
jgi:condensin-2 complex subunit D3